MRNRFALLFYLIWISASPAYATDIVITAGIEDNFVLPADPASPSAALLALPMTYQNFDLIAGFNGGLADRQVAHTFVGLPANIESATLELKLRAGNDSGVSSDGVLISFVDAETVLYCGGDVVWARSFAPTAGAGCFPVADATGLVGSWNGGQVATIVLDLGALPLPGGGTLDLIPQINSRGFFDVNVSDETGCDFMRLSIDTTTTTSVPPRVAKRYVLSISSYPNPFNPTTTIRYTVPAKGRVDVDVLDLRGAHVATLVGGERDAGAYTETWNGRDDAGAPVSSGVYFARVRHTSGSKSYKLVLMK